MFKYFKQEEGFSYFSKPNPCIINTFNTQPLLSSDLSNKASPYNPNIQKKPDLKKIPSFSFFNFEESINCILEESNNN